MKLLRKLVVALLMLLLVAIGSPLKVSALPNNNGNEWPTKGSNDVTTTLPQPPAVANVVDLNLMFNYPTLNYFRFPYHSSRVIEENYHVRFEFIN